ncbi:tail fiber/spike domain-containing protein [Enterobacter ludwigii]
MATQPTNLPVPSESPRDLKFNAGKIDEFVTSLVNTYVDRFGNEHYTIEGLRWLAQQAIAQYGWIPVGTFQAGATLTLPNQILKDTTDGEYYRWDGSFLPDGKVVSNGSTPGTTGGIGVGAWISVGDSTLRALLASANGAAQVGTSHRGLLSSDLNAIDRRPSGYGDSVETVLSNGQDIEIASDVSVTSTVILSDNKSINGRGGKLSTSGSVTYGLSANSDSHSANGVNLHNYISSGVITSGGAPGYALLLKRVDNAKINGMTVDTFSGAVEAVHTTNAFLSNILATNTVYHPTLSAGGYGALLENAENTFVDGVNLSVGSGNNGRHVMYVSRLDRTDGGYDGCQNLIATRIFGKYVDKDDRNFPGVVFRKSNRTLLHDFIIDGANGGIGYNVQNGNVLNNIIGNGALNIFKYQDGTTVRAISQGTDATYFCSGFVYHDMYIEVMPKVQDGTLNYQDCVAFDLAGRNGLVTNCITKVARSGRPFYIESGTTNVVIDGIVDVIEDNGSTALTPFISFNGSCSNISVKNIKTSRPMFTGLYNVTDMTVDWTRRATVTITSGAAVISNDTYGILSTVSPGASSITIALASHVTQDAVLTARIIPRTANHFVIETTSSKTLGIKAYTIAGASVTPSTSSMTFDVVLSS